MVLYRYDFDHMGAVDTHAKWVWLEHLGLL